MNESLYQLHTCPPHIYTTAQLAYNMMRDTAARTNNQACLVSGESGAGKTEACKSIMRYLAHLSEQTTKKRGRTDSIQAETATDGSSINIETRVLKCNPFLEVRTTHNNSALLENVCLFYTPLSLTHTTHSRSLSLSLALSLSLSLSLRRLVMQRRT